MKRNWGGVQIVGKFGWYRIEDKLFYAPKPLFFYVMKREGIEVDVFVVFYILFTKISRVSKQFLHKTEDYLDGVEHSEMDG